MKKTNKKTFSLLNKIKDVKNKRKSSLKISKRQSKQSYNFNTYKENKDIKVEIEKRYKTIINTNNNTNQFIEIMQNAINTLFLNVYMII